MAEPMPPYVAPAEHMLLDRAVTRRAVILAALRPLGIVATTLLVYALIPIEDLNGPTVAVVGGLGLAVVIAVFVWRLARIPSASRPVIAAIEALCLVFGMFLCLFALVYVSLAVDDPNRFTQPLNKVSAVYFSVTVLATVGFGDIAPVGDLTRTIVTVQMVLDLLLIGATVKLLGISARAGVRAQHAEPGSGPVEGVIAVVADDPPLGNVTPSPTGDPGSTHPKES